MENFTKEKALEYLKNNKKKSVAAGVVLLVVLALVLSGLMALFSGSRSNYLVSDYGYDGYARNEIAQADFAEEGMMAKGLSISNAVADIMPYPQEGQYDESVERKLIKNGNLSLIVKDIDTAQAEIKRITNTFKGFVQSSNFSENEQYDYYGGERKLVSTAKRGYFEIKIPSKDFERAFVEYKEVALKVNNESTSGSDVTEQYADLESQIKNKKAEVAQYREIMKRASKIEDVLKVTQYLNNAQSAFDRLQGQMNRLSNQVELSTIRIDIVAEQDVEIFGVT